MSITTDSNPSNNPNPAVGNSPFPEQGEDKLYISNPEIEFYSRTNTLVTSPAGGSGTEIFGGYLNEEYLSTLSYIDRAFVFDKMRRSEPAIVALLTAIKNLVLAGSYSIEVKKNIPEELRSVAEKQKSFLEWNLFGGMNEGFFQTLYEVLSFLEYGFSLFEFRFKNEYKDGQLWTVLKALEWRSPKTIYAWRFRPGVEELSYIEQYAYGDNQPSLAKIRPENSVLFSFRREGKNYEGISILRPCYGAWRRKKLYLDSIAVGVQRYGLGTIHVKTPKVDQANPNSLAINNAIENFGTGNSNYLKTTHDYDVQTINTNFDPEKMTNLCRFENNEMFTSILARFLLLGEVGGGGSRALGDSLSDFFMSTIDYISEKEICSRFNQVILPKMCSLNFKEDIAVEMRCENPSNNRVDGELSDMLSKLSSSGFLHPDTNIEQKIREKLGFGPLAEDIIQKIKDKSEVIDAESGQDKNAKKEEKEETEESDSSNGKIERQNGEEESDKGDKSDKEEQKSLEQNYSRRFGQIF